MLSVDRVEQMTRDIAATDKDGNQTYVANLTFSWTAEKRMYFSCELTDQKIARENLEALRGEVDAFLKEGWQRAQKAGLPVPAGK